MEGQRGARTRQQTAAAARAELEAAKGPEDEAVEMPCPELGAEGGKPQDGPREWEAPTVGEEVGATRRHEELWKLPVVEETRPGESPTVPEGERSGERGEEKSGGRQRDRDGGRAAILGDGHRSDAGKDALRLEREVRASGLTRVADPQAAWAHERTVVRDESRPARPWRDDGAKSSERRGEDGAAIFDDVGQRDAWRDVMGRRSAEWLDERRRPDAEELERGRSLPILVRREEETERQGEQRRGRQRVGWPVGEGEEGQTRAAMFGDVGQHDEWRDVTGRRSDEWLERRRGPITEEPGRGRSMTATVRREEETERHGEWRGERQRAGQTVRGSGEWQAEIGEGGRGSGARDRDQWQGKEERVVRARKSTYGPLAQAEEGGERGERRSQGPLSMGQLRETGKEAWSWREEGLPGAQAAEGEAALKRLIGTYGDSTMSRPTRGWGSPGPMVHPQRGYD